MIAYPGLHPSTREILLWGLATEVIPTVSSAPWTIGCERLVVAVVLLLLIEVTGVADSVERVHSREVKIGKLKLLKLKC